MNVINKAGASGTTGTWEVRNAKPDGYTMLMQVVTLVTNPAIQPELPYKWDDLAFVARVSTSPLVLIVKGNIGIFVTRPISLVIVLAARCSIVYSLYSRLKMTRLVTSGILGAEEK